MVRVIFPPICTVVVGVNTRTGATVVPAAEDARVIDVNVIGIVVMARAFTPADNVTSALDDILKPPVTAT